MNRPIYKKGVQRQVVAAILVIGIASTVIGLMSVYFFGRASLEQQIGQTYQELAQETARSLEKQIHHHLREARTLSLVSDIRRAVNESNASYGDSSRQEIAKNLAEIEARWVKDQGVDAYMHDLLTNNATAYLRSFDNQEERDSMLHMLLLVTDVRGAVVAATRKPKHYDFSGTDWWQRVNQEKTFYITDIEFSETDNAYTFSVAYPIMDNNRVIGTVYMVHNAQEFFRLVTDVKVGRTDHTMLASSDGTLLFCPIFPIKGHHLGDAQRALIMQDKPGWGNTSEDVHYPGKRTINGFAPVTYITTVPPYNFGGKRWYVFTSQSPSETFAPIYALLKWVALTGLLGAITVTLIGYLAARRIIRPIRLLREGVDRISAGDLDHAIHIHTGDEIEELATAFNHMSEKLQASYSGLEAKIAERTRELEVKNRELFALYAIVSALNQPSSSADGFRDVLNKVMVTLHTDAISLTTLIDSPNAPVTYAAPRGFLDLAPARQAIAALEKHVAENRRALYVEDLRTHAQFNLLERDLGFVGAGVIPLIVKDRLLGFLSVLYREAKGFTSTEQALLASIVGQLGASLENLRLSKAAETHPETDR